ncbi:hypothetical protein [Amycolatopsis minnesotensis]
MRRSGALVAVAASSLLLAACGGGPSQVGAAAIVDGQSISLDGVQTKLDTLIKSDKFVQQLQQQRKLDLVSRAIVSREVLYKLVDKAAQGEGLRVDERNLDKYLPSPESAQTQGSDDPAAGVEQSVDKAFAPQEAARHRMLLAELSAKYIGRVSLTVDRVQLQDPAKARDLADRIAREPQQATALMQQAAAGGEPPSLNEAVSNNTPQSLALFAEPGSVLFTPSNAQQSQQSEQAAGGPYQVIVIKKRDLVALPPDLDPTKFQPDQLIQYSKYLLRPTALATGINLNPRYGQWDTVNMQAGPADEAAVAGKVLTPKSSSS